MLLASLAALITFALFMVIQALALHWLNPKFKVKTIWAMAILICPLVIVIESYFKGFRQTEHLFSMLFSSTLILTFLWFGYLQFYFIIERGISPRHLVHLLESKVPLSPNELESLYSIKDVVERRVGQMVEIGMLGLSGGKYENTRKGNRIGFVASKLKSFLRLGDGG